MFILLYSDVIQLYVCIYIYIYSFLPLVPGFPSGLDGKEFVCNAGDPSLIPGLGRSPGEGNGYSFQFSCMGNPMDRGAWWATVHGITKSRIWPSDQHIFLNILFLYGLSQDSEYSFLCYIVGPYYLFILYIILCVKPFKRNYLCIFHTILFLILFFILK